MSTPTTFPLLVPGAEQSTATVVTSPWDGAELGRVGAADAAAVEQALATAHRLYTDRAGWLPGGERIAILERLVRRMSEREDELALQAAREGGKPLADSRVEAARAIDGVKSCIEVLRTEGGEAIPMDLDAKSANRLAVTQPEPIGPVVALSAFNHPLNLIVHQVGPAVAAGCPVIVKPAEATPLSGFDFVSMLHEAGLPPEWCQCLTTNDHEVTGRLVCDERVGFLSFIGSAKVGWMLRSKLAPGTRCALEHGGAAPVLVAADADLEHAVAGIAKGGFYHAGQVCVSVQRVFVEAAVVEKFTDALAERAKALVVGDPADPATEVGPLIRPAEVTRVGEWVDAATAAGADARCGALATSAVTYAPTVLLDPPADAKVSCEEIFGPVVCVYPFTDWDDAIARANDVPFAFQAGVYTRDIDTAMYAYRRLDAAAVMVNDHSAFRVDWMPFAGLKRSGHGVGGIPYTFRDMRVEKLLVLTSPLG